MKAKVLPRSLWVILVAGFSLFLAYSLISLFFPGWDIDSKIASIPKWILIPLFSLVGLYLIFDLADVLFGVAPEKDQDSDE